MEEGKLKAWRELQNEGDVTVPSAAKRSPKRKNKQSSQQIISLSAGGFWFTVMCLSGHFFCSPLAPCRHPSLFIYMSICPFSCLSPQPVCKPHQGWAAHALYSPSTVLTHSMTGGFANTN